mmetsp:Transcript_7131/g.44206  ORF Transcript_7131/g.44206 Transcript_7131/m.44206 type:complete len:331 (-) Transcript_7131:429-1421(-)
MLALAITSIPPDSAIRPRFEGSRNPIRQSLMTTMYGRKKSSYMPRSLAFTTLGQALGSCAKGPSTNGSTSWLPCIGYFCNKPATLHAANVAIPPRVQREAEAMCGRITALGQSANPGFMSGSSSNTSSPQRNSGLAFRWATRAVSSMTGPLELFTRTASFFILLSLSAFIRWVVVLSSKQCRLTTSLTSSSSSTVSTLLHVTGFSPWDSRNLPYASMYVSNCSAGMGLKYTRSILCPSTIIFAYAVPILPAPMMPTVFPCSSFPTKRSGSHPLYFPFRMNVSASTMRLAAARVSEAAISAVVSVSTPGVLPTGIPLAVAAATSTLLYPTA